MGPNAVIAEKRTSQGLTVKHSPALVQRSRGWLRAVFDIVNLIEARSGGRLRKRRHDGGAVTIGDYRW